MGRHGGRPYQVNGHQQKWPLWRYSASEIPAKSRVRWRFIGLPVLICFLDIGVRVRVENLSYFCIGTNVELSFVNEKDVRVDVLQFASHHAMSAKTAILGGIFGRIFVEGRFIRRRGEMIGCRPVSAREFRVTFHGTMFGEIRHRIETLQNYAVLSDVYFWFDLGFLRGWCGLSKEAMIANNRCL